MLHEIQEGSANHKVRLTLRRGLSLLVVAVGLWALGNAANAKENGVILSHPWVRTIIPSRPAAGYFTLTNHGATERMLVGAASPDCGTLMLHKSISENGVERMVMEKQIAVPAHGQLRFAPGGYHLMCMKPTAAVHPGGSIRVTLKFKDAGTISAEFPVHGVAGK